MRKFYLLCCVLLCTAVAHAQVANYSFSPSSGTYTALAAPTNVFTGAWDDNTAVSVPIGFSFTFNGTAYTTAFVHPNGYITFGSSTSGYVPISGGSGVSGVVSAWGRDLQSQNTAPLGSVDYASSGGVFTVQWSNTRRYNSTTVNAERFEMQIQLFQTTNVIKIVYGTWSNAVSATTALVGEVGLRGTSSSDFKNLEVLSAGNWATPTSVGTTLTSTCYYNEANVATKPALGQTYTFTPPPPCVAPAGQGTALGLTAISPSQINGSFTATTADGYLVVRYPTGSATTAPVNGTAYTAAASLGLGKVVSSSALTTFNATGLTPSTAYDFYVYSYNSTACSGGPVYNVAAPPTGTQSTTACAGLSGTITVGPTGTYTSLTAALTAASGGLSGPVIFELQPAYLSTVETFPLTFPNNGCASAVNTITVRPAAGAVGLSITSANATATVDLNAANYVVIDGRPGGVGTTSQLSISNTATGSAVAIRFINDASNNTVKYCSIAGSTTTTLGVVAFSTGTTTGNDNNTISNNDIGPAGANLPLNGIYSLGTSAAVDNSGNIVTANNIFDYFNAGSATNGMNINSNNSGWTITNNKLYQTANRIYTTANTHTGINITSGSGYTISGNIIGFANNTGTGTTNLIGNTVALTGTFPGSYTTVGTANATRYIAINCAFTAAGTMSEIQNNTIAGFALYTSSGATTTNGIFCGIAVTSGNVNIGTTTGNTIGSTSGTGSIYTATTTTGGIIVGIYASSSNAVAIRNNTIGALDAMGTTAAISGGINGINIAGTSSSYDVSGNTIGNTTNPNLRMGNLTTGANLSNVGTTFGIATGTAQFNGILSSQTTTGTIGTAALPNIIRNASLNSSNTSASIRGITASGSPVISNNNINNITSQSTNASVSSTLLAGMGIFLNSISTNGAVVKNNTISSLSLTNTTATGTNITGVAIYAGSTDLFGNKIYDIGNASTSTTAATPGTASGFFLRQPGGTINIYNNMVSLGNGQTTNTSFNGIWQQNSVVVYVLNAYFNSINIEGPGATGAQPSFCLNRGSYSATQVTITDVIKNNVFTNTRSGGTGKHYAIANNYLAAATATGWGTNASNNNVLNAAAATVGYWGADQTFAAWKTSSACDGASISGVSVPYVNTATGDLHVNFGVTPTQLESGGVVISGLNTDYDNQARPGPAGSVNGGAFAPDMGADEFDGVFLDLSAPSINYTLISNTLCTGNVNLSATITDASNVNVTTGTKPRIYYKKATNANTYVDNTNATNGWKYTEATNAVSPFSFTLDISLINGGVAAGDVIQYFVVAQDQVATPNVGINSGAFTINPANVALTAAAFPITGTINSYTIGSGGITGTVTIGAAGTYPSLTGAGGLFAAINGGGLTGNTTVNILDASVTESGATALNQMSFGCGGPFTLTIKPNTGVTSTLTGSLASNALIRILSSNVVIDGSNSGTTSRDLTITNTSATGPSVILLGSTGTTTTTNTTLKNAVIINGVNTASAIVVSDGTTLGNPGYFTNVTIQNNSIQKAYIGLYCNVAPVAGNGNGINITSNSLNTTGANQIRYTGIYVQGADGATVSGNDIGNFETTSGESKRGIWFATGTTNSIVEKNLIHDINYTGTSGYGAYGVAISTGLAAANVTVRNNMIRNISGDADSYASFGGTYSPVGIYVFGAGQAGVNLYYNTIYLSGNTLNFSSGAYSFGILLDNTAAANIKNNIINNNLGRLGTTGVGAVGVGAFTSASQFTSLDYNDYWVASTGSGTNSIGKIGVTDYATLATFKAATGADANSRNVQPVYVSATDLHLSNTPAGTNWCLNGAAIPIAGITSDIDGDVRNAATPDIGADEFNVTGDAAATPASQTVCSGTPIAAISYTGTGTTFTWTRDNTGTVTGIAASGTGNITGTLVNTTSAPITVTFTIIPSNASGCAGVAFTATVLVNPTPVAIATPASQTPCTGTPITTINLSSATTGTTYTWTRDNTATVTGIAASGSGNSISGTLTNTTAAPITVTFTITPSANGCAGLPITATVVVNVGATITPTLTEPTTCVSTDGAINLALSGAPGPFTFAWTGPGVNPTAQNQTGLVAGTYFVTVTSGNGCITSAVITLNGPGGCSVCPVVGSVTTNPAPTGCIGTTVTLTASGLTSMGNTYGIIFKSYTAATADPYTGGTVLATVPNGSLTGLGTTATATTSFAAANNYFIYAILTPTPLDPLCRPSATTNIVINPTPDVVAAPTSQTVCSGTAITTIAFSGSVVGTTYNWTRNNTATVTGIAANGSGNITGTLTNTTGAPITVTFTITPTAGGCPGTPVTATVLVNPTPTVTATPASQTVCSGTAITTIVNSGSPVAGTVYNWTRDNTATVTGIAASGSGNIAGTLTNTTGAPITVTFTITPTANGCPGTPVTATVTVNPLNSANATPATQTICSGSNITPILITGVAGATFTWTRDNVANVPGGIPASGSGSTISGFMINTTNAPVTVTFTITPSAGGCPGIPTTVTVVVNPFASAVATPVAQTACSGSPIATIALTGNVAGATYSWTRDNTATLTGIAASGTGNITGTLVNTTTAPVTTTFTITPSFGGCPGPVITASVTVNPTPVVTQPANQTLCNGANTAAITFASTLTGTTYAWTNNTTSIGLAASGTGNIPSFAAVNTGITAVVATITVTPTTNGCTGTPKTFTITVNPTANVNAVGNQTLCPGATTTAVTFAGTVAGTTFTWTNNTPSIGLAASGTGNIPAFTAVNTTSTAVTATITVTPTAGTCAGTPRTFTITVNGISVAPTGATATTGAICGPGTTDLTVVGGALGTGASWKWYSGSCGGTLVGTGATITGVPVNGTATFWVRAEGTCNTTTCASVTVTVNAQPTITLSAAPYTSLAFPLTTAITANINPTAAGNTIVWFKDGAVINGAVTNVLSGITVDQLGTYQARVTTTAGCTALSAPLVIKDSASDKFFVMPNPNNGQFRLRYYTNNRNFGFLRTVNVYDSKGALVYSKAIPVTAPYSNMDIDIRKAGKGLFLVVLGDDRGKQLAEAKVVVQ